MTSTIAEPVVLKTDGRGRVRTPETRREALLDEFERSGLSGIKLAALCGVKNPSFANWVQRRRRRRTEATGGNGRELESRPAAGAPVLWWEAVVDENRGGPPGRGLILHLPGGVRMEITGAGQVRPAVPLPGALAAPGANGGSGGWPGCLGGADWHSSSTPGGIVA